MADRSDTATRILDVAQRLAQTRGYNGFSYADVAAEVGVRSASIHYHFPSKGDLGRGLIGRYRAAFAALFARLDREGADPRAKLAGYADAFGANLRDGGRMCLAGMLAADIETLPTGLGEEVRGFIAANETWLAGVLAAGREGGVFAFVGPQEAEARRLFAGLEGAMLVARTFGDPARFEAAARQLLAALEPPADP